MHSSLRSSCRAQSRVIAGFILLIGCSVAGAVDYPIGYVFYTSAIGTGNLGSWAAAGGHTGTAAGDAVCASEATSANLPDASDYVAIISDSQNDFYCRVQGYSGTKANKCGQASLPPGAGPWLRMDKIPFATWNTLLDDNPIAPISLHTDGSLFTRSFARTGTQGDMTLSTGDTACTDWTSATTMFTSVGIEGGGGYIWLGGTITSGCDFPTSLMCIKRGAAAPLAYSKRSGRLAFLSATQSTGGNLSSWSGASGHTGIAAGDAVCQSDAATAGLRDASSFRAWLSDSTQSLDAKARFVNDGPWVRTDGIPLATSRANLAASNLQSHFSLLPDGVTFQRSVRALTGTSATGTATGSDCAGWTSAGAGLNATYGDSFEIPNWSEWFGVPSLACTAASASLYCLSDLDRIFDGGMETIPY